jgi:hypothetical protein
LSPGEAGTGKRNAFIIADTGRTRRRQVHWRTRRRQVHWLDAGSDELLRHWRVLNGSGIDLAADQTRLARRRCDVILGMLRTHQPCQPARAARHTELADAT